MTAAFSSQAAINLCLRCSWLSGRINIPAVFVTGGVMDAGPDLLTLEQIGKYSAMFERGEITEEQFTYYKHHACPSCGACSFMGTASTMQIMAESLGLMLPGTALMPATCEDLSVAAEEAGKTAVALAKKGMKASDIVTLNHLKTPSWCTRQSPAPQTR